MVNQFKNTDIEKAFRATVYCTFLPGLTVQIRLGRNSTQLDQWLRLNGFRNWSFVTPYNPQGRIIPNISNARRYQQLVIITKQRKWQTAPAEARSESDEWPIEPGLVVFGVSLNEIQEIAVFFEQLAIVRGVVGNPPELIWV